MARDTSLLESRIQRLELELAEATERSRKARLAVKEAKVLAKLAKKARKQARKALAVAQSELEPDGDHAGRKADTKKKASGERKIADSPERKRKPRKKREKVQPPAEAPATPESVAPSDAPTAVGDVSPE